MKMFLGSALALAVCLSGCSRPSDTAGSSSGGDVPAVMKGLFTVHGVPTALTYAAKDGHALYQGDIVLGQLPTTTDGVASAGQPLTAVGLGELWPNRVLPYVISPALPHPERVTQAMDHWQTRTAIRFVPRTTEADYLNIVPGNGCSATVGHAGGMQTVNLGPDCDATVIIHELGHSVGLWHEQSRYDRDQYVTILWNNVQPGREFNFGVDGQPLGAYDLHSVMHYFSTAFSANGQPTIVQKNGAAIPYNSGLSPLDIAGIAALYDPRPTCLVQGDILATYQRMGGAGGALGECVTSETATSDGVGRFNHFQKGSIYASAATGAHAVTGVLRDAWAFLGWERSPLGYPTSDGAWTPDQKAYFATFQGGAIYQTSPTWTAFEVQGAIYAEWAALGGAAGALGLPTTNETATPDGGGRFNHFTQGSIYWSPATGAHEVLGAIHARWAAAGWERGPLGYPVSDEYDVAGGRQSDFQHGHIKWEAATGTVTVF